MRGQVAAARAVQAGRFHGSPTRYNADMTHRQTRQFCQLDDECQNLLKAAMTELGLSARAHDKVLRVARTIADLDRQRRHPPAAPQRGDQLPDAGSAVVDVSGVSDAASGARGRLKQRDDRGTHPRKCGRSEHADGADHQTQRGL